MTSAIACASPSLSPSGEPMTRPVAGNGVASAPPKGDKRRVLIVDDDPSIIESISCALVKRGYEVLIARDGAEALIRAERDAPDLIVLDVIMPKRSGLNVLDRIRSRKLHAPHVIIITADAERKYQDFVAARGVEAFIAKPFRVEDLVARIDAVFKTGG